MKKGNIPFAEINVKDNYEFGFKLGSALKENIKSRLEKNKKMLRK